MRRSFDWYGLTLPAVLLVGAVLAVYGALGGGSAWSFAGGIMLVVGAIAAPFWAIALVRARRALAAARRDPGADAPGAVVFAAEPVSDRPARIAGLKPVAGVLADRTGIRLLPAGSGPSWSADWSGVASIKVEDVRSLGARIPLLVLESPDGQRTVLRMLHDYGWQASIADVDRAFGLLRALRRRALTTGAATTADAPTD